MKSKSKKSDGMIKKLRILKTESVKSAVAYERQRRQNAILKGQYPRVIDAFSKSMSLTCNNLLLVELAF